MSVKHYIKNLGAPLFLMMSVFQNLYVIQKIGAEKVQWAQHFINRGFEGELFFHEGLLNAVTSCHQVICFDL